MKRARTKDTPKNLKARELYSMSGQKIEELDVNVIFVINWSKSDDSK